jgi:hypothetical protein
MTHPHQREMAEKLGFLAFQAVGLPVQPEHWRFVDSRPPADNFHDF